MTKTWYASVASPNQAGTSSDYSRRKDDWERWPERNCLAVLGDVKASVQDKLGIVDFSDASAHPHRKNNLLAKSRLIEALAGEQFNFTSGTLGSRRPTVLEFSERADTGVPLDGG